jgi:hypothetical protein
VRHISHLPRKKVMFLFYEWETVSEHLGKNCSPPAFENIGGCKYKPFNDAGI